MLHLLAQQPAQGWTQSALETALHAQGVAVNRVTVYRALDRLTAAGVLERRVDAQRMGRYFVALPSSASGSSYLECTACHQHFQLGADSAAVQTALQSLRQALAQSGVAAAQMQLAVHAECAQCAAG